MGPVGDDWELKSWEKPLIQAAKTDLNRSLIPKLTLGLRINVYSQRTGFVLRCLSYLHWLFPGCWVKDHLHKVPEPSECCSQGNSTSEVTLFLLSLFYLFCLGLSLMQVGTKPESCLLDSFVSSTAAVRAVKWSNITNFSQCPQRLLKLTALEKAFKDPGSPEDTWMELGF